MRLDRFLSNLPAFNRQRVRMLLAEGRTRVDGATIRDPRYAVSAFSRIEVDDTLLQVGYAARYVMLHKPTGCVSATQDPEHPTVLDLLPLELREGLHIAGRLDYNTTGLLLLTNDGQWSRRLTQPQTKQPKVYLVDTERPIEAHYVERFEAGFYFAFEDLTTLPARLEPLSSHQARLTLVEGRYHQVKRMFGYFNNKVVALHRERMGAIALDASLAPGMYRPLTEAEIASV